MRKKHLLYSVLIILMAAAAGPLDGTEEGDPLASPSPRSNQRITAPVTFGENPEVVLPEGDLGDITPSGGFFAQDPLPRIAAAPLSYVILEPLLLDELISFFGSGIQLVAEAEEY